MYDNRNYYIIRHGQTVWNLESRKQGHKDSPLTLKGIEQAHHISSILENQKLQDYVLIVSPLGRCKQFSSIICENIILNESRFNNRHHWAGWFVSC